MMFVEKDRFRPQDDEAFAESATRHANTYFAFLRLPEASDSRGIRIADFASDFALIRSKRADPEAKVALVPPLVLPRETHAARRVDYLQGGPRRRRPALPAARDGERLADSFAAGARRVDLGFPVPDADDLVLAWRGAAKSFRAFLLRPLRGVRPLGEDPAADRVQRQDRGGRHRRNRPARSAGHAHGQPASGGGDPRYRDREPQERRAKCATRRSGGPRRSAPHSCRAVSRLSPGRRCPRDRRSACGPVQRSSLALNDPRRPADSAGRSSLRFPRPGPSTPPPAWQSTCASAASGSRRWRSSRASSTRTSCAQLVDRGGIETARREVTLLFSDIRGFTTLSETRTPEEVVALLNRYFSLQVDVVFAPRRHARQVHRRLHHGDVGRAARRARPRAARASPARSTWPTRCKPSSASSAPSTRFRRRHRPALGARRGRPDRLARSAASTPRSATP